MEATCGLLGASVSRATCNQFAVSPAGNMATLAYLFDSINHLSLRDSSCIRIAQYLKTTDAWASPGEVMLIKASPVFLASQNYCLVHIACSI